MSLFRYLPLALLLSSTASAESPSWWDAKWPLRKKITIDPAAAAGLAAPVENSTLLIRLHEGNFQFLSAREDGSDIRFVAEDGKTVLSHHIEKFNSLLNEAYVWVKFPSLKPGAESIFWLYYGNPEAPAVPSGKESYDAETALVYHFSEISGPPVDASGNGLKADNGGIPIEGALIAGSVRLTGQAAITISQSLGLDLSAGQPLTWSAWIKPQALQANAVIFAKREGGNALVIGENNGIPYVEIVNGGTTKRTPAGEAIVLDVWRHLAVVADPARITLYLDGKVYGTLDAGLPALKGPSLIGRDTTGAAGFSGEIDELQISRAARSASSVALAAVNQGASGDSQKFLATGEDEANEHKENEILKHLSLFGRISKSLTFDGWAVIVLCIVLAVIGWTIAIGKFLYLNKVAKATQVFLSLWRKVSDDITALDHADEKSVKSLGGAVTGQSLKIIRQSPLFELYHLGSQEIQKRVDAAQPDRFGGLSGRSIQAIRAVLDGGRVREVEKLNGKLVFLTIGIAGGPYLGLLGTVIGVMITFAVIAESGEVDINSIAPGIAGALLATVAGLAVAIPALFAYSYLSSRIKGAVNSMQIFIDEFITRIAEAYPVSNE
jgi:biopolymer transport protein ExbB